MKQRLVTILTPCYNGGQYIAKLFDSVLSQTYKNIEMIVVDDGSEDNSAEIIKAYVPRFQKRGYELQYQYQTNQGQSVAINSALKQVTGDYLVWPDADDYYSEDNAIEKMVEVLDSSDETVSMVRVQYTTVDSQGLILARHYPNEDILYKTDLFEDAVLAENGFWYPPGGYMAKMAKIDEYISDREIYTEKGAGQNFQLYLPLLYKQKCLTVQEFLYTVVAHDDSHSRDIAILRERHKSYYRTIRETLRKIPLNNEYRDYLLRKVRATTINEANSTQENSKYRYWVKRFLKGIMPHAAIVTLRKRGILKTPNPQVIIQPAPEKTQLEVLSDYDNEILKIGVAEGENIEGRLLFCAHVLEKAMSRVDFEAGHNFFRLEQIASLLDDYEKKNLLKNSFAYEYALSSIKSYILLHEKHQFSTTKIRETLGDEKYTLAMESDYTLAGYKVITKEEKQNNKTIDFAKLQTGRYSVREFAQNKKVDLVDVRNAIELSMKAPSVCNRQPARVRIILDPEIIKKVLDVQGGFHGYPMPPCLLSVSVDVRSYVGFHERNQGFIDGGSFAMSLLLSLEYYGLAACPLHNMFTVEVDQKIKNILNIKTPEYLIMCIAVGQFDKKNKVAVSSRYPGSEITEEYL